MVDLKNELKEFEVLPYKHELLTIFTRMKMTFSQTFMIFIKLILQNPSKSFEKCQKEANYLVASIEALA